MKKILILTSIYEPGVKGGGPIQSIKNLADNLGDKYKFAILTLDRDLGDLTPYNNVKIGEWISYDNTDVYYINKSQLSYSKMLKIIKESDCDFVYLNSFFSYRFSIIPIILKKIKLIDKKIILAPRGEFSPGALKIKQFKKRIFIYLINLFSVYKNITWHATSKEEKKYICENINQCSDIFIAPNYVKWNESEKKETIKKKKSGKLNLMFLSRISPKKNLLVALKILEHAKGDITFNIYGPIEDIDYWNKCEELIKKMPNNISVEYHGLLERKYLKSAFSLNHFLFFPTLGENFGHVIAESLIEGCPVILSDQTPWRNLEECQAGWSIPLNKMTKFVSVINECVEMNQESYNKVSLNALEYIKKNNDSSKLENLYSEVFSG